MVSWKKRYERLKAKANEISFTGKITGFLNSLGRRGPTLAFNLASAIAALGPIVKNAMYHIPRGEYASFVDSVNRDYNPIDPQQKFFINKRALPVFTGTIGPQVGKKVVQKVGSMI